jgi:hypothetical protein
MDKIMHFLSPKAFALAKDNQVLLFFQLLARVPGMLLRGSIPGGSYLLCFFGKKSTRATGSVAALWLLL